MANPSQSVIAGPSRADCSIGHRAEGMSRLRLLRPVLALNTFMLAPVAVTLPRLKISENQRYLVTDKGQPFFWLGDTAWELFHRLDRDEAGRYIANRAERRFTVVQAVVLAELDGLNDPN